jgi:hypothetical protein
VLEYLQLKTWPEDGIYVMKHIVIDQQLPAFENSVLLAGIYSYLQ